MSSILQRINTYLSRYFKVNHRISLATMHPEASKFWHHDRNLPYSVHNVSSLKNKSHSISKTFWWKCPKGDDHEFESTIENVLRGIKIESDKIRPTLNLNELIYDYNKSVISCPICNGDLVVPSNSFKHHFPKLSFLWHPHIPQIVQPETLWFKNHDKSVFWKPCEKRDHITSSSIERKLENTGCAICEDSLAKKHPELLVGYDITKNENISLYDIISLPTKGTNPKWGLADNLPINRNFKNSHRWFSSRSSRVYNSQISYHIEYRIMANCFFYKSDKLLKGPDYYGLITGDNITNRVFEWKCENNHVWNSTIKTRLNGTCPQCKRIDRIRENSISKKMPQLIKYWHPKNKTESGPLSPDNISIADDTEVWWKCSKKHEWYEPVRNIVNRTRVKGFLLTGAELDIKACKQCKSEKVKSSKIKAQKNHNKKSKSSSLERTRVIKTLETNKPTLDEQRSDLVPFWHPTKNKNVSIKQFREDSSEVVWWKCPESDDHEWQDSIIKTTKRKKTLLVSNVCQSRSCLVKLFGKN